MVIAVSASLSPSASASGDDAATARALLKEGYDLSRSQTCAQAIPLFERSLHLSPTVKAWLNLARCEEQLGRLRDALGHWARARDLAREQGLGVLEHAAVVRLAALEPQVPSVSLRVDAAALADVAVVCDGVAVPPEALARPIPLDPGAHVIAVSAPGRALRSFEVTLATGEHVELAAAPGDELPAATPPLAERLPEPMTLTPAPAPTPADTLPSAASANRGSFARTTTLAGFGVAAVGLVVGSAVGGATIVQASSARAQCNGETCSAAAYEKVESARRLGDIATVAFGAAAVGIATGLIGMWLGAHGDPKAASAAARPAQLRAWAAPVGGFSGAAAIVQGEF